MPLLGAALLHLRAPDCMHTSSPNEVSHMHTQVRCTGGAYTHPFVPLPFVVRVIACGEVLGNVPGKPPGLELGSTSMATDMVGQSAH